MANDSASLAYVGSACGRCYLSIAGIAVAMEGDPCRETQLPRELYGEPTADGRYLWTVPMLRHVAERINAGTISTYG